MGWEWLLGLKRGLFVVSGFRHTIGIDCEDRMIFDPGQVDGLVVGLEAEYLNNLDLGAVGDGFEQSIMRELKPPDRGFTADQFRIPKKLNS